MIVNFTQSTPTLPLIDGWQISPTYVMIGASIKPTPRPNKIAATYISSSDFAKNSINQPMMCGILTKIIDFFLPSGSKTIPEATLPIGWNMNAILANQDAWASVNDKISFESRWPRPLNAGIHTVGKATENWDEIDVKLRLINFF